MTQLKERVLDTGWLREAELRLPPGLSYERWEAIGRTLRVMEKGVQFWLGDWINYGEREYGERYAQAVEETGYTHGTLRNMAWVAREIPASSRDDNLTFSHHRALAGLEPEARDTYRTALSETPMSVGELRGRIKSQEPVGTMVYVPQSQLGDLKELARCADLEAQKGYVERWGDPL